MTTCDVFVKGKCDMTKVQLGIEFQAYPFDLSQVRLLDGPFKQAMELDRQYLLELNPDRMLSVIFKNSDSSQSRMKRMAVGAAER